jgi:hypothetical protein
VLPWTHLLEGDNVDVVEHAVVEDLTLYVLVNLQQTHAASGPRILLYVLTVAGASYPVPSLDELDGHQLGCTLVPHKLGCAKVAAADVANLHGTICCSDESWLPLLPRCVGHVPSRSAPFWLSPRPLSPCLDVSMGLVRASCMPQNCSLEQPE